MVQLWDIASGTNIATLRGHSSRVRSVAFSPDGKTIASRDRDNTILLWDVETREIIATLRGHTDWYDPSFAFSPDGTLLAGWGPHDDVLLWDVASGTNIATLEVDRSIESVSFSPDGTLLAVASRYGDVMLWDVALGTNIATLEVGGLYNYYSVSFSPDGTLLASGCDAAILIWNVPNREHVTTLQGHTGAVTSVSFSPDGTTLASSGDGTILLWDVAASPYELVKISGDYQRGTPDAALPNPLVVEVRDQYGNLLPDAQVTFTVIEGEGKLSGQFTVEQVTTDANGRAERTLTLGLGPETHTLVRVSIVGDKLVTFGAGTRSDDVLRMGGHYRTWHIPNGVIARLGKGRLGFSDRSIAFSSEGQYLAVASGIGIWLYDVTTFRELTLLPTSGSTHVSFSPDGTLLASGSSTTVKLWDMKSGQVASLKGHTSVVNSVSFSPDGTKLASGSFDNTVKLWDVSSGQVIASERSYGLDQFRLVFAGWYKTGFRIKG